MRLPAPAVRAPAVPAGTELRITGLTPFFTSNASFYRVDTDLVLPQVAPETWTLRIDGMVDRALEISFAELLRMPLTETDITLVCVSNAGRRALRGQRPVARRAAGRRCCAGPGCGRAPIRCCRPRPTG